MKYPHNEQFELLSLGQTGKETLLVYLVVYEMRQEMNMSKSLYDGD
jgi:hypothetical protein